MTEFLQSNLSLVIGPLLAIVLFALRTASKDRELRRDLKGALILLATFLVLRSAAWLVDPYLGASARSLLKAAWMLTMAFGTIRGAVSLGLWMVRLRSIPTPKILRDVIDGSLYVVAAIPILESQFGLRPTGLLASSAIVSLVIGLALQDTLGNLFAGLSLQLDRPFQVGDWVTIGQHTGRIAQVAWRATRIETNKGESITLPNNLLAKEPVRNFTRGTHPIGVDAVFSTTYDAAPNDVKDAVLAALLEMPQVLKTPEARCRATAFEDSSIRYLARFFISSFSDSDQALDEAYTRLWYRLRRAGIDPPYPQRRIHTGPSTRHQDLTSEAVVDLLRSVDLFTQTRGAELTELAADVRPVRFGRGERILVEGEGGDTFYLVAHGEVSVRTGSPEREVAKLGRGQYFGEMSLLTGEPRAATVLAVEDTVLVEFDRPAFARLFESNPGLAKHLSALLAHRRQQLRSQTEGAPPESETVREAGHIFGRLRSIFALKD